MEYTSSEYINFVVFVIVLWLLLKCSVLGFKSITNYYYKKGYDSGYLDASNTALKTEYLREQNNRLIRDNDIDEAIFKTLIGKIVVAFPNEWQDPTFLVVRGMDPANDKSEAKLVGYDILRDNVSKVWLSNSLLVDEQLLETILKLNPFERWNMVSGSNMKSNIWSKSYPNDDTKVTPPDILRNKVLPMINQLKEPT